MSVVSMGVRINVVLLALVFLSVLASTQGVVFLRNDLNVTLDSSGSALTASQALSYDLGARRLKTSAAGIAGVATSALGTLDSTQTSSLALGASYVRNSRENISHLPLCVMSFFVDDGAGGSCYFVPDPPLDNWDTLFSKNTIAAFPLALNELDSAGNVVARFDFQALTWERTSLSASTANSSRDLTALEWTAHLSSSDGSGANGENSTMNGTVPTTSHNNSTHQDAATVSVAFVQSSLLGVINLDETPVLPKTWQMIVSIRSYKFETSTNALNLEVATATGFGVNRTVAGLITLAGANDTSHWFSAYAQMDRSVIVSGSMNTSSTPRGTAAVQATSFDLVPSSLAASQLSFAPILVEQLTVRYGAFGVWRSNVTFPGGATDLDYEIRSGIGPVLEAQPIHVTPHPSPHSPAPSEQPGSQLAAASTNSVPVLATVLLSFVLFIYF